MKPGTGEIPVIGIAGWKKSGKTTLVTRLITELTPARPEGGDRQARPPRVPDRRAETDSARHRRAGAAQVAVVSRDRWAMITELRAAPEPDLAEVLSWLDPCDLVIVEGYKGAAIPKIEVRRSEAFGKEPLADDDRMVLAIAADHAAEGHGLPVFSLDDVAGIADFILARKAAR